MNSKALKIIAVQLMIFGIHQSVMYYFIRVLFIGYAREYEMLIVLFH